MTMENTAWHTDSGWYSTPRRLTYVVFVPAALLIAVLPAEFRDDISVAEECVHGTVELGGVPQLDAVLAAGNGVEGERHKAFPERSVANLPNWRLRNKQFSLRVPVVNGNVPKLDLETSRKDFVEVVAERKPSRVRTL